MTGIHEGRGAAWPFRALFLFLAAGLLNGCYLLRQGLGQADILLNQRDLRDVQADPQLSEARARKLDLIFEARRFAVEELGFPPSPNYSTWYETGRRPVTWVVSAVRKDSFAVRTWWFPIIGSVPYKGHFDVEHARAEAEALERDGWDVAVSEAAAFSTLGWFRDPVFSSMLGLSEAGLASTILHELTHGAIYVAGHSDFNESLAEFVGNEAALQLLERRHGSGSAELAAARRLFSDSARFDAWVRDLYARLDAYYRGPGTPEEKIRGREEYFEAARREWARMAPSFSTPGFARMVGPGLDNAWIVARIRYGRYNVLRRVYERVHGSWPAFFATVSAAAATGDPLAALDAPERDR